MKKEVTLTVDEDIYEKFCIALNLTKDTEDLALEKSMRWYITKTFEKASNTYKLNSHNQLTQRDSMEHYGMANQRIPKWSGKPNQYNHKIIRAYFQALATTGKATLNTMRLICSDPSTPEFYVPTFSSNYAQMKLDGPKSHGKVFEDDGDNVWIWSEVETTLMDFRSFFESN